MSRIKILQPDLRNKIAAGEVIERPASVVKELIENSIDALSTDIRIEITNGGKHRMAVSDNGIGLDHEDALLAFQRHATSKLLKEADLFHIVTLGFRGEALPAIASVSKVTLTTRAEGAAAGLFLELSGGELKEKKEAAHPQGTSVVVKDLFYNTPARKKFLKSTSTELYHIIDTVTRTAMSHWDIGFRLITDHHQTMELPLASGIKERLIQIYGKEFLDELSEVTASTQDMSLHAFVSNTRRFRNSKSHQFIFVNRRPVKDPSVSHAVYKAFEGILPQDKHPVFFVFIESDPSRVDFNVHPAKREIRFDDKETVYRFVRSTTQDAVKADRTAYAKHFTEVPSQVATAETHGIYAADPASHFSLHKPFVSENLELQYRPSLPHIYLGGTFIAVSGKGGLTIIDHHAAHERVLFEKLLRGVSVNTVQLLFPKQVRLSAKEHRALLQNIEVIKSLGIEIEDFGQNSIIIRSLPEELNSPELDSIMSDIAAGLIEGKTSHKSLQENLAAVIACHSSVRGKDILTQEEIASLVEALEMTENPDQCPHGRPTRLFYSLNDLNKLFKRK